MNCPHCCSKNLTQVLDNIEDPERDAFFVGQNNDTYDPVVNAWFCNDCSKTFYTSSDDEPETGGYDPASAWADSIKMLATYD